MNEQVVDNIRKINDMSKRTKILSKYNKIFDKIEVVLSSGVIDQINTDNKIALNLEYTLNKIDKQLDDFINKNIEVK